MDDIAPTEKMRKIEPFWFGFGTICITAHWFHVLHSGINPGRTVDARIKPRPDTHKARILPHCNIALAPWPFLEVWENLTQIKQNWKYPEHQNQSSQADFKVFCMDFFFIFENFLRTYREPWIWSSDWNVYSSPWESVILTGSIFRVWGSIWQCLLQTSCSRDQSLLVVLMKSYVKLGIQSTRQVL